VSKEVIGLIGVIIGALIAFGGNFINLRYKEKQDKNNFKRTMLEEIHISINTIVTILEKGVEAPEGYKKFQMDVNTKHIVDTQNNKFKENFNLHNEKFLMLVSFYFENLLPNAEKLSTLCSNFVDKRTGRITSDVLKELTEDLEIINEQKEYFLRAIYAEVVKYI
jgi:hypothetical protein